jgi:hypothetical protein
MKPTNIPSSPSGWHGPNFVHELETPVRLKDLTEFSVHGKYIQSGYNMGKTYVGLFDSNGAIVALIYWGDSWISSAKGYFHVVFYPEGGGGYGDGSGYIYGTIDKTGKLWVDDGVVNYEISGQPSGTLASVVNPYRLITHVVILANRASGYALGDMRIEDIKVAEGAYTGVMDPGESDGTMVGNSVPDTHTYTAMGIGEDFVDNNLQSWWVLEIFWPVCHLMLSFTIFGGTQLIHLTLDLLGTQNIVALQLNGDSTFNEFLGGLTDFAFGIVFSWLLQSAVAAMNIYDMASIAMPGSPWALVALGVAVALTILAYIAPIAIIEGGVADGSISHGHAALRYFALFFLTLSHLVGWKSIKSVLGAVTAVLLGCVFDLYLCGAGIWGPWIEEVFNWKCRWSSVILLGACAMFAGLCIYHAVLSL